MAGASGDEASVDSPLGSLRRLGVLLLDGYVAGLPLARSHDDAVILVEKRREPRRLDRLIAESLTQRGVRVVTSATEPARLCRPLHRPLGMGFRPYLIDMRVDLRDAESNILVATGRSFQGTFHAMGRTPSAIIDVIVAEMLGR